MANIVTVEQSSVANIDEQLNLIKLFGLPETMIERYYVRTDWVKDDDHKEGIVKYTNHPGMKPKYVLCKREAPISIFDDGDNKRCVSGIQKTYAERLGGFGMKVDGLRPEVARSVIENQLCQSVDVGDVDAFASI